MSFNNIDSPEEDYLFVQLSQIPNAGNGLFTAIEIYKDEFISVFKGEILSHKQAKERALAENDRYFIVLLDGRIMDSQNVACFAKYANDANGESGSPFKNNSKIVLNDEGLVSLVALRKIKTGEEIFCSYGKKYWKKHSNPRNMNK